MGTQFDGVEFLCAEIAEREERAVGSESRPNPHGSKSRTLVLKVLHIQPVPTENSV